MYLLSGHTHYHLWGYGLRAVYYYVLNRSFQNTTISMTQTKAWSIDRHHISQKSNTQIKKTLHISFSKHAQQIIYKMLIKWGFLEKKKKKTSQRRKMPNEF